MLLERVVIAESFEPEAIRHDDERHSKLPINRGLYPVNGDM